MPQTTPTLTVIMPAYNEEAAIADAVEDVRRCVFPHAAGSQLLVVDDGSRDQTGNLLDQISAAHPRVLVQHKPNGGHGSALLAGLDAATTDYVMLIDSDRQMPLDDFSSEWAIATQHDGFFATRMNRADPRSRLMLAAIVRVALRLCFGVAIRDANAPYKIFKRSLWVAARPLFTDDTLAPSLFLSIFARRKKFDIVEQSIPHRARETGVVSIRHWKLFKFCCRAFLQLLRFRLALFSA